jgi:hypothetical protein
MALVTLTIIIIPGRFASAITLNSLSRHPAADGLSSKRVERNGEKPHSKSAALCACTTSRATPTSNAVNASKNPALAA